MKERIIFYLSKMYFCVGEPYHYCSDCEYSFDLTIDYCPFCGKSTEGKI